MTKLQLLEYIKIENMKNILPIVKHNEKLMNNIKIKLTKDVNLNNEIIIKEIQREVSKYDETRYKYYESEILALIEIL